MGAVATRMIAMPSMENGLQRLLILGTALVIFWHPLTRQIPLKASDVVFALALCVWVPMLLQRRRRGLGSTARELLLPLGVLVCSLLVATLVGDLRYHLTMSRDGGILLIRLLVCMALFLATYDIARADDRFAKRISLAFLAPVVLFPALLIPALSAPMWDTEGRFQGFTVNANTANQAFCIALALASTLAVSEAGARRPLRATVFVSVAAGMLTLIFWTQSRAYLAGGFASVLLAAILGARIPGRARFRVASLAAVAFVIVVAANLLLAPGPSRRSYVTRMSLGTWGAEAPTPAPTIPPPRPAVPRAATPAPQSSGSPSRPPAAANWVLRHGTPSFGHYGTVDIGQRAPSGMVRRVLKNPHIHAALLYMNLLPFNPLGIGVNYQEKFFIYFAWSKTRHHGVNSIVDIPIYGGAGAILSVGYLMWFVARRTRERLAMEPNEAFPYAIGAVAAFWGLWIAAVLLGSPIFDYQFWIVTALALI